MKLLLDENLSLRLVESYVPPVRKERVRMGHPLCAIRKERKALRWLPARSRMDDHHLCPTERRKGKENSIEHPVR